MSTPDRCSLDIFRGLCDAIENDETLAYPGDVEELVALSRWVGACDKRATIHVRKGRWFKCINELLSTLSAAAAGVAGVLSVMLETGALDTRYTIAVSVVSFVSAIAIAVNNSVLDAPGKYREHMSAEARYNYLASTIAVCLATYDTRSGMSDFTSARAALRFFLASVTHINDTSPDA